MFKSDFDLIKNCFWQQLIFVSSRHHTVSLLMTTHQHLTFRRHDAGENTRAEREGTAVRSSLVSKGGVNWAGAVSNGAIREEKKWDISGYFTWHQKTTRPQDFYSASVRLGQR